MNTLNNNNDNNKLVNLIFFNRTLKMLFLSTTMHTDFKENRISNDLNSRIYLNTKTNITQEYLEESHYFRNRKKTEGK